MQPRMALPHFSGHPQKCNWKVRILGCFYVVHGCNTMSEPWAKRACLRCPNSRKLVDYHGFGEFNEDDGRCMLEEMGNARPKMWVSKTRGQNVVWGGTYQWIPLQTMAGVSASVRGRRMRCFSGELGAPNFPTLSRVGNDILRLYKEHLSCVTR